MSVVGPWLPAAPCTLGGCLPADPPVVGRTLRALRAAALVGALPAVLLLAAPARLAPAPVRAAALRSGARLLLAALGIRLRVRGAVPRRPVLVVANHISWLDVLLLAAVCPGRTLAKAEVAGYPLVGTLARCCGTLFIERERLRALPAVVAGLARALRGGDTVVAFPEGSTWCGRRQGPFRPAVFQAAVDAGVPVQPVALAYRQQAGRHPGQLPGYVAAFVGEDTLPASLRRVRTARGLVAEVTLLPPLEPGPGWDRGRLARRSTDLVMTQVKATDYAPGHDRTP